MSERRLLHTLMVRASEMGARLFRNNVGALKSPDGRIVRFGVGGNGGSDLIGWRCATVTPEMVGKKIAIFFAVEAKTGSTRVTENQQAFIDAVNKAGGIGLIVRDDGNGCFRVESQEKENGL